MENTYLYVCAQKSDLNREAKTQNNYHKVVDFVLENKDKEIRVLLTVRPDQKSISRPYELRMMMRRSFNEGFKKLQGEQKILVVPEIILIQEDVWSFLSQVRMLKKYLEDNGIEKCCVILSPFRCKLLYLYSKILDFSIMRYTAA